MSSVPHYIQARNVNHALPQGARLFNSPASVRRSAPRANIGGHETLEMTSAVITEYTHPLERVLFDPKRDANPFFHFFESLWILAGRDDVKWLEFFLPGIAKVSDDTITFHGAYGARMRDTCIYSDGGFEKSTDQLAMVVEELKRNPDSRRAVVGVWQPMLDAGYTGLDMPCNCTLHFQLRKNKLNLTVFNRSNDMIWGAYGANAVQFSFVLEYVSGMLGVKVGSYYQISNNFHVYLGDAWDKVKDLNPATVDDPYLGADGRYVKAYLLISSPVTFDHELGLFMTQSTVAIDGGFEIPVADVAYENTFFSDVAIPLFNARMAFKQKKYGRALIITETCKASDWGLAAQLWLLRHEKAA